jgi:hypothetical protein
MKIWFSVGIKAEASDRVVYSDWLSKLLPLGEPDLTNFSVFVHFNIADFKSNVTSFYW